MLGLKLKSQIAFRNTSFVLSYLLNIVLALSNGEINIVLAVADDKLNAVLSLLNDSFDIDSRLPPSPPRYHPNYRATKRPYGVESVK